MNPKDQQIHAENAARIERERAAMLLRYPQRTKKNGPRFKVRGAVGESSEADLIGCERHCLRCEDAFTSTGSGHRLCNRCRRLTEGLAL